ncbi:MAG: porin [Burkholderiales bacterium]|nr:porin [Burkholderiales bacterium]
MKKSFLALALMGAFSGAAFAQSSVTVYGVVDMGLVNDNNGDGKGATTSLDSGLQSGSRLGFKGTEDLGNGLKANFVLEMGLNADKGTSDQGGLAFGRQAFVGLSGDFGSVNLGRQKSLTYVASEAIDPFAVGLAGNMHRMFGTVIRNDNALTYTTTNLSGFVGAAQYGFGEQAGDTKKSSIIAVSGAYAAGPVLASLTYEKARDAKSKVPYEMLVAGDIEKLLAGGTYDFGVVKAHAAFERLKVTVGSVEGKANVWMIGATVPVGAGAFLADYTRFDDKTVGDTDTNSQQFALGYTYSLSKRTNVYTSYAYTKNDKFAMINTKTAGATDKLINVGIRHAF